MPRQELLKYYRWYRGMTVEVVEEEEANTVEEEVEVEEVVVFMEV